MGIQSTIQLTREDAEERLLDKMINDKDYIRILKGKIMMMTDTEIEDELDEQFYNFMITKQ